MPIRCEIKRYIQPFERRLALLELESLSGHPPEPVGTADEEEASVFEVQSLAHPSDMADALAYWERVGSGAQPTRQVLREATANVVRNGIPLEDIRAALPFREDAVVPTPNRRSLRYGPHGLHEYRGKFFPQLVRSLINIGDVPQGGTVLDPMCGSGTTAVETILSGRRALGVDLNPLSVRMSLTKCAILTEPPKSIEMEYERARSQLLEHRDGSDLRYLQSLPPQDQTYLRSWFAEDVLHELDVIAQVIARVSHAAVRNLMWLALSNVLRPLSWQKVDDLRVRKEVRLDVDLDPIREFLEELGRSVRMVLAFLYQERGNAVGEFDIREGNATQIPMFWWGQGASVDAVITSPPYATALPYLDTDRLSLTYLGLLQRTEQRRRDRAMIGNREIPKGVREAQWARFKEDRSQLPGAVSDLIQRIYDLNAGTNAGFRRLNLPSLLSKYFFDMREVFLRLRDVLKLGAPAFVVVGDNHTIAGGERVDIETSRLLGELAASVGFSEGDHIPMEMLTSRDIFKKNSIASETILILRNAR